jgi:adenylate cyclase
LNKINHRNNQWREAERGLERGDRRVKAPTLPLRSTTGESSSYSPGRSAAPILGSPKKLRYLRQSNGKPPALAHRVNVVGNFGSLEECLPDPELDDIFALQDELTMSVIGAIEPTLRQAEIERAKRKRPDSLDAYDLYLRALPFAFTAMPEFMDQALPLLQQAVAIEPDYALAHAYIAWCNEIRHLRGGLHDETRAAGLRHAHLAIATGGDDATALAVAAFVIGILEQDYQTAFNAFDRAMALSPSSAQAFGFSSIIRAWAGDSRTSVEHAETAIRLSPFDPLIYFPHIGSAIAHFFAGDFDDAVRAASRAAQANPRFSIPCVLQAASLASLGRIDEAKASAQRLLSLEPTFSVGSFVAVKFTSAERLSMLAEALRQAGLPE